VAGRARSQSRGAPRQESPPGTQSTGRSDSCSSLCATDPSDSPRSGLSCQIPTTITSASCCSAAATSAGAGRSSTIRTSRHRPSGTPIRPTAHGGPARSLAAVLEEAAFDAAARQRRRAHRQIDALWQFSVRDPPLLVHEHELRGQAPSIDRSSGRHALRLLAVPARTCGGLAEVRPFDVAIGLAGSALQPRKHSARGLICAWSAR
jgi:hypothetical protein